MYGNRESSLSESALSRDSYLAEILTCLSDVMETNIGDEDAEGFVAAAAHRVGREVNDAFRERFGRKRLSLDQIAETLVALKSAVGGSFRIESVSEDEIVVTGTRCPFGPGVLGRHSLCAMTSGEFGRIVADNTGYARVNVEKSIAGGDNFCRLVIGLKESAGEVDGNGREREYFDCATR